MVAIENAQRVIAEVWKRWPEAAYVEIDLMEDVCDVKVKARDGRSIVVIAGQTLDDVERQIPCHEGGSLLA